MLNSNLPSKMAESDKKHGAKSSLFALAVVFMRGGLIIKVELIGLIH